MPSHDLNYFWIIHSQHTGPTGSRPESPKLELGESSLSWHLLLAALLVLQHVTGVRISSQFLVTR